MVRAALVGPAPATMLRATQPTTTGFAPTRCISPTADRDSPLPITQSMSSILFPQRPSAALGKLIELESLASATP